MIENQTKYFIVAMLAVTMFAVTMLPDAIAEKKEKPESEIPEGDGALVVAKKQPKQGDVSIEATSQTKNFSWTDCSSTVRSGWFTTWLNTPPTSQVTYSWQWPSSTKGGFACTNQDFESVQNHLTNVAQGWTVHSLLETSYSNINGKTYNIVDNNGNPMYVQSGNIMQSYQNACYGWGCTVGHTFYSNTWVAT